MGLASGLVDHRTGCVTSALWATEPSRRGDECGQTSPGSPFQSPSGSGPTHKIVVIWVTNGQPTYPPAASAKPRSDLHRLFTAWAVIISLLKSNLSFIGVTNADSIRTVHLVGITEQMASSYEPACEWG